MRQTLLLALFCGCAAAQYYPGAGSGSSTTPCSATVTTNCAAQVNSTGNYVPPVPGAGVFIYYLQDTASAVATYKQLLPTPYTPKTTETYTPANGTHVIQNFITQAGVPGLTFIPAGQFEFHVHASRAAGPFSVYAEFWEANASGVDIHIIGTTEQTSVDTTETEYRLFFINVNPYTMATSASRVVCRVWAITNSNATARLYVGDTSDSHIAFPSSTVDVTNFVPYVGATADLDMGAHGISAPSFNGAGVPQSATVLGTNASKQLIAGPTATTINGTSCTLGASCSISAGASPGLVLVEQHTAAASTTLAFTTCISATYDTYEIVFVGLLPTSDGVSPSIQLSTDGGGTWISSGYTNTVVTTSATATTFTNTATTALDLAGIAISNVSTGGYSGVLYLYDPLSVSKYKRLDGVGSFRSQAGVTTGFHTYGTLNSTSAINAFQIIIGGADTFASGTVRCYGLTK